MTHWRIALPSKDRSEAALLLLLRRTRRAGNDLALAERDVMSEWTFLWTLAAAVAGALLAGALRRPSVAARRRRLRESLRAIRTRSRLS